MSVQQAFHEFWARQPLLTAEVPSNRFYTGDVPGETLFPYATLMHLSATPKYESGDSYTEDRELEVSIYCKTAGQATFIGELVETLIENAVSNEDIVLPPPESFLGGGIFRSTDELLPRDFGVWQFRIVYRVMLNRYVKSALTGPA